MIRVSEVSPTGYRDCTASAAVLARKPPLSAEKASKRTIGLDAPDDFGHTFERPITDTKVIEDLYCADFAHLQDVYNRINQVDVDENPV